MIYPGGLVSVEFGLRYNARVTKRARLARKILPHIENIPENIINICQYGFTEMFNNTIDHSASFFAAVRYRQTYRHINIQVSDSGVGIFHKLQSQFHLHDPRQALLELSKGRLTSDPSHHTGH